MATLSDVQNQTITEANSILEKDMTLEEKLSAIEKAMQNASADYNSKNPSQAPIDPMDALQCAGCQ